MGKAVFLALMLGCALCATSCFQVTESGFWDEAGWIDADKEEGCSVWGEVIHVSNGRYCFQSKGSGSYLVYTYDGKGTIHVESDKQDIWYSSASPRVIQGTGGRIYVTFSGITGTVDGEIDIMIYGGDSGGTHWTGAE